MGPQSCHACGGSETIAQVSDQSMDFCYSLCKKCLYGEWPAWEVRKARLLAELESNLPTTKESHDG